MSRNENNRATFLNTKHIHIRSSDRIAEPKTETFNFTYRVRTEHFTNVIGIGVVAWSFPDAIIPEGNAYIDVGIRQGQGSDFTPQLRLYKTQADHHTNNVLLPAAHIFEQPIRNLQELDISLRLHMGRTSVDEFGRVTSDDADVPDLDHYLTLTIRYITTASEAPAWASSNVNQILT